MAPLQKREKMTFLGNAKEAGRRAQDEKRSIFYLYINNEHDIFMNIRY